MDTLSPPSTSIAAGALLAGVIVLLFSNSRLVRKRRLPPGPRRLPLIGNAHQMPKRDVWSVFADWGKIYGAFVVGTRPMGLSHFGCRRYRACRYLGKAFGYFKLKQGR